MYACMLHSTTHSHTLMAELGFCGTSHRGRRRYTTRCDIDHLIDQFRTGPLLMGQQFHLFVTLLSLNVLYVRQHAAISKGSCELGDNQAVRMESSQCDELPHESQLAQVIVEVGQLLVRHTTGVPVEGRGEVVGQHLMRIDLADTLAKLLGFGIPGTAVSIQIMSQNGA